jgi:anti-sigma factor RsiW
MCELCDKLVAWLDGELSSGEAVEIEHHIRRCEECKQCVASYKEISAAIVSHCESRFVSQVQPPLRLRSKPVFALAAAAAVVFLLFARHASEERPPTQSQVNEVVSSTVPEKPAKSLVAPGGSSNKPVHKTRAIRVSARPESQEYARKENWVPGESVVQITIPAESMFAPGAVPQGASFSAELILAADGSAQSIRLRP